ncbi:ubiquinol-cytochrome c reductase-like protein [Dinothrombium tinctorium]|uniref:Cytochrome b-c1 complex subunit 8 n=1 Tax=Dinothrombium tinctorium TaxID=1965070 RepID=A0A3S3Q463_9ACAR|nr:ubiquinol-cytochrome c reductase-like protein [Dinothrombium tinctorium]
MAKGFGHLAYIRNVVYVRISPYEQKAFANFWQNSIRGVKRDFLAWGPYIIPPFLGAYLLTQWANATYEQSLRKKPEDYANDT